MYSEEIKRLLEFKNYLLTSKEYIEMCEKSPQIVRVTYNPFEDTFRVITSDNYEFRFKVRKL